MTPNNLVEAILNKKESIFWTNQIVPGQAS